MCLVHSVGNTKQFYALKNVTFIQSDTKKRELLKCVVATMYRWQHCGTGTLSYRQPRHSVIMDQWNGQRRALAIKMFYKNNDISKVPLFLCHPVHINLIYSTLTFQ
jgi:hypothetical protein